ncbi:MAG: phosphate-starvation-inducible PsiE family protein [Ktedonobacterales bacterium]
MLAGFSLQAIFTNEAGAQDVIALVSDLLLTLIIMEVLGTVVHHLRDGETTLRPFLFIGIISATRGILAVGARLSVSSTLTSDEFIRDMVELGVNAWGISRDRCFCPYGLPPLMIPLCNRSIMQSALAGKEVLW